MNRPILKNEKVASILKANGATDMVCLLSLEGFFNPGANKIGIYDDAMFLYSPTILLGVNANVDPSRQRKHMATLKYGKWPYKPGIHGLSKPKAKQYMALVQAGKVTVSRYQEKDDTGYFGINIHRGAPNSTSSLGCQTIYPEEWQQFIDSVYAEMKRYNQKTIEYVKMPWSDK